MRVLVTAGPTREYIDDVRFLTNASSGRMGYAVAAAAAAAGHDVTLLTGPVELPAAPSRTVTRFVSVADLAKALAEHFPTCDALVMAAAVGDFRAETPVAGKIRRGDGAMALRLVPTEDVLAAIAKDKRDDQTIIGFAVEAGSSEQVQAAAREKLLAKNADFIVANTLAAMTADESEACILSRRDVALPWANRSKEDLAEEIVKLLEEHDR